MFNIQSAVQASVPITEVPGAAAFAAASPGPATRKTFAAPDRQKTQQVQMSGCGGGIAWKTLNFPIWTKMLPREAV